MCAFVSELVQARRRITKSNRRIASGFGTFPSTVLGQGGELVGDSCPGRGDDSKEQQSKDQKEGRREKRSSWVLTREYELGTGKMEGRKS